MPGYSAAADTWAYQSAYAEQFANVSLEDGSGPESAAEGQGEDDASPGRTFATA